MSEGGGGDSMMMMMMMMMFMGCASSSLVLSGGLGWMAYEDKFCEWWDMFCEEETGGGEGGGGGGDETETDPPSSTTSTSTTTKYTSQKDQAVGGKPLGTTKCATSAAACKAKCTANSQCMAVDYGGGQGGVCESGQNQCYLRGHAASRYPVSGWTTYCKGSCPKTVLAKYDKPCRGYKVKEFARNRIGSAVYVKTPYECAKKCTSNCKMFEVGHVGDDPRARCLLFSKPYEGDCGDQNSLNMLYTHEGRGQTVYKKNG
jgi:hypothetical protein